MDEYVNLPSGFLFAGAQSVVSSLWSVGDESTELLMDKMYDLWHGGATIAAALTGTLDPDGIHGAIWDYLFGTRPVAPADRPLTLAAYRATPPTA